ncbi:DUF4352 domain-containing protein [Calorimonas adulescens]|jgi:Telomeric repeat-binding factor 2.|nr:DUF4352 domain-containing protein [Calorimonas adulescens]
MLKRFAVILSLLLIFTLVAGCGETATPEKVGESSTTSGQTGSASNGGEKEPAAETFKIGDVISIGDYVLTVNGTRTSNGDDFLKPDEGNTWYIIDATVENKSDKPVNVSSLLMFKLSDGEGYSYDQAFGADTKGSLDGELAPGRKMRGELAYEIPKDASGLELIFDADVWGSGQAIVKLDR